MPDLRGSCHCGALAVRYRYSGELRARACQCTFCRRHGGLTASDPAGRIRFVVREDTLQRYQFLRKQTDFMLCNRCGCYLGAMIASGYACVNVRCCLVDIEGEPMVYEGESASVRNARREERWSPADVVRLRSVPAQQGPGAALLGEYYAELAAVLGGFEPDPDLSMAPFFVLEDEEPLACGGLARLDQERIEIKRMFTRPPARGRGIARDLLHELEEAARREGASEVVLDTAAPLQAAQSLYASAGYREVPPYNDNPYAAHWFAKRL